MLEFLKVILLGIVEGITEWLPISSTGHLILVDEFIHLKASPAFMEMFNVVIQLGAIMAVVVLYFHKLNPFSPKKNPVQKKRTIQLWIKVVVACIPAAVLGLLFDDWMEAHFHNYIVVSIMLIVYGVLFIIVENWNKKTTPSVTKLGALSYKTAFLIGAFQVFFNPWNLTFRCYNYWGTFIGCIETCGSRVHIFPCNSSYVWCQWIEISEILRRRRRVRGNGIRPLTCRLLYFICGINYCNQVPYGLHQKE